MPAWSTKSLSSTRLRVKERKRKKEREKGREKEREKGREGGRKEEGRKEDGRKEEERKEEERRVFSGKSIALEPRQFESCSRKHATLTLSPNPPIFCS